MPKYLASYDLDQGHSEFMIASRGEGWTRLTLQGLGLYRMPETTIRGAFPTRPAAMKAFIRSVAAAEKALRQKIQVKRRLIAGISGLSLVTNDTAPVDLRYVGASELATCLEHQRHGVL